MKTRYTVALPIIASFGLGALVTEALHAQAAPPAYVVTLFGSAIASEVMNTNYPSLDPSTFQQFGGHYIIHFGREVALDGEHLNQIVVIKFDSMENARAWHELDAFKQAYDVNKTSNIVAYAVEGTQ